MLCCKFYGVSRTCVAQVARRGTLSGLKTTHEIRLISNDYVGLNVGGKIYQTSRSTLTRYPNSFFAALMESDVPSAKDDQGNLFIDRDGEIFRHVLNFLRCGELVLPERFSEFTLLEREADFFQLHDLKLSIRKPLSTKEGIGLVFHDGNIFNTTRETLMKEDISFFTKMLNGEIEVARDPQGNYVLDRDGRLFHHILSYLRHGGIFSEIEYEDINRLEEEAEYFGLPVLVSHVNSLRITSGLHVYYSTSSVCVGYVYATLSLPLRFKLFCKTYRINEYTLSGIVDLQNVTKEEGSATIEDISRYLGSKNWPLKLKKRSNTPAQKQLNANCIRLEIR